MYSKNPYLITGEDVILCRNDSFKDLSYFVLTRKEFDSFSPPKRIFMNKNAFFVA